MTGIERDNAPDDMKTLPYRGAGAHSPRLSHLAFASLMMSIVANPCVVSGALGWLVEMTRVKARMNRHTWVADGLVWCATILVTLVPVAAMIRIGRSGGTRTGMGMALAALVLNLAWWMLMGAMTLIIDKVAP